MCEVIIISYSHDLLCFCLVKFEICVVFTETSPAYYFILILIFSFTLIVYFLCRKGTNVITEQ
jgi:hypothetical protein